MTKISIDAMGTEQGIAPVAHGLADALKHKDFHAILVGDENIIKPAIDSIAIDKSKIEIFHTTDAISMEEGASQALKRKDSSIFKTIELVKNNTAHSCVSAGHSGATMSIATLQIGRIAGVLRPAICTYMPTIGKNPSMILDAGANTDCKPEFLVDFALMGYYYCKLMLDITNPRVGLLANGEEDSKGNELTKEAFKMLSDKPFFKGNVEGGDIFNASVDVIVCDGFTGNIALKASEGVASAIGQILKDEIKRCPIRMIGGFLLKGVFRALKNKIDYAEYGGAPLLGIKSPVIISHGKSNARAIECAIYQAIKSHEVGVCKKIAEVFAGHN